MAASLSELRPTLATRPGLAFFYSAVSGPSRRAEGFLAQVLQHRGNHETFKLYRVEATTRPDLVQRFGVSRFPTLLVIESNRVVASLELPRGCVDIERFLAPWLT